MATPREELEQLRALAVQQSQPAYQAPAPAPVPQQQKTMMQRVQEKLDAANGMAGNVQTPAAQAPTAQVLTPRQELEQLRAISQQGDVVSQIPTGIAGVTPEKYSVAEPKPEPTMGEQIKGAGEAALTTLTGMTGGALGYLGGTAKGIGEELLGGITGTGPQPGSGYAEEQAAKGAAALTYQPRTEAGKEQVEAIGEAAQQLTPLAPMMAEIQILGSNALRGIKRGVPLIDEMGEPTLALRKALEKEGLVYENLSPEARQLIPSISEPRLLPSPNKIARSSANKALVQQIKSGGRDDALAGLKVVGDRVVNDPLGNAALKQGWEPGFVQAVKTANPQTKLAMEKMLTRMQQITKNKSLANEIRPSDIAGNAALSRYRFIRNKANDSRLQLDVIAKKYLPGKEVDIKPVVDQLSKSLDDLNIELTGDGIPKPIYRGSDISLDPTSQGMINKLIGEMASGKPGVKPDAYRLHRLKRQLDRLIDFQKKSEGGLTDAGRDVLKDVRRSINNAIRDADPAYAKVNDVLSKSLTAMDDFKDAIGPSVAKLNMYEKSTDSAVGTKLRTLMSNNAKRVELDASLRQLDDVANELGGAFNENYKDLARFANELDNKFGTVAETSFKGDISASLKQAANRGARETLKEAAFSSAAEKANKLRGINDFNAFKSMRDLLKRRNND